ncbi:RlpA-like double-psi beta-barrel-protein domain-containing protein-containing protein [Trametes meyenii]|nr:RlpA-like double-psi beta-barrel-protein domain-containing protein-containing protein [Trametes meyenii]
MVSKLFLSLLTFAFVSGAQAFTGDATFYHPQAGGQAGACGSHNKDSELVVALNPTQYAKGAHCFNHISVHYKGKSVDAKVVDLCPGCGDGSIDLSPAAFKKLAPESVGRLHGVKWNFK